MCENPYTFTDCHFNIKLDLLVNSYIRITNITILQTLFILILLTLLYFLTHDKKKCFLLYIYIFYNRTFIHIYNLENMWACVCQYVCVCTYGVSWLLGKLAQGTKRTRWLQEEGAAREWECDSLVYCIECMHSHWHTTVHKSTQSHLHKRRTHNQGWSSTDTLSKCVKIPRPIGVATASWGQHMAWSMRHGPQKRKKKKPSNHPHHPHHPHPHHPNSLLSILLPGPPPLHSSSP